MARNTPQKGEMLHNTAYAGEYHLLSRRAKDADNVEKSIMLKDIMERLTVLYDIKMDVGAISATMEEMQRQQESMSARATERFDTLSSALEECNRRIFALEIQSSALEKHKKSVCDAHEKTIETIEIMSRENAARLNNYIWFFRGICILGGGVLLAWVKKTFF